MKRMFDAIQSLVIVIDMQLSITFFSFNLIFDITSSLIALNILLHSCKFSKAFIVSNLIPSLKNSDYNTGLLKHSIFVNNCFS